MASSMFHSGGMCKCVFSCVQLFVIPWTVSCQAPPSMEFSRQEYWSGLPFLTPGNLRDPEIKLTSWSVSPALTGGFFSTEPASWEARVEGCPGINHSKSTMLYSEQINPSSSKVCSVVVFIFRMKWQIYKPVPKLPKSPQQSSWLGIGEKTLGEGWQRAVVFCVWGQSHKEECGLKYNLCLKTVSLEEGMLLKRNRKKALFAKLVTIRGMTLFSAQRSHICCDPYTFRCYESYCISHSQHRGWMKI